MEQKNLTLITDNFGDDYKSATHNEITFNCPFCMKKRGKADTDHKLYVNTKSLKFHCFKCGTSGRLKKLVNTESAYGVYEKLLKFGQTTAVSEDDDTEDNMFYFPVTQIIPGTVAYDYCLKRGITEDLIKYYDIRLGIDELFGRIVIPNNVYGSCWTDMYSARSMIGQIPKYKNPTGAKKNTLVFNLKSIKPDQEKVIIVEGVITAICGGKDCVATYGCHPSDDQLNQIISRTPKSIYCCLDGDEAGQSGMKALLEYLSNHYKGKLYYVTMPKDQDACDMGYAKFRSYIEENKREYAGKFIYEFMKDSAKLQG